VKLLVLVVLLVTIISAGAVAVTQFSLTTLDVMQPPSGEYSLLYHEGFEGGLGGWQVNIGQDDDVMLDPDAFEGDLSLHISWYLGHSSYGDPVSTYTYTLTAPIGNLYSPTNTFQISFAVKGSGGQHTDLTVEYIDLLGTSREAKYDVPLGGEWTVFTVEVANAQALTGCWIGTWATSYYYNKPSGSLYFDDFNIWSLSPLEITIDKTILPAASEVPLHITASGVSIGTAVYVTLEGKVETATIGTDYGADVTISTPPSGTYDLKVKVSATEKTFQVNVVPSLKLTATSWQIYAGSPSTVEFQVADSETGRALDPETLQVTVTLDGAAVQSSYRRLATGDFEVTLTPQSTGLVEVKVFASQPGYYQMPESEVILSTHAYSPSLTVTPSTATPNTARIGETVSFTFQVTDHSGNPVDPNSIAMTVTSPSGSAETVTTARVTRGIYTFDYTPAEAGTYTLTVTASAPGWEPGSLQIHFTASESGAVPDLSPSFPAIPTILAAVAVATAGFFAVRRLRR